MVELAVLLIAIAVVVALLVLCFLAYHQMLLTNEVNKRLLVLSIESRHNEAATYEEVVDAYRQLDEASSRFTEDTEPKPVITADGTDYFDPFSQDIGEV